MTSTVTSLFRQAVTIRGDTPRTAGWSLVFLFPTLVLGPHRPGPIVGCESGDGGEDQSPAARIATHPCLEGRSNENGTPPTDSQQEGQSNKASGNDVAALSVRPCSWTCRHQRHCRCMPPMTRLTPSLICLRTKEPRLVDEEALRRSTAPGLHRFARVVRSLSLMKASTSVWQKLHFSPLPTKTVGARSIC